LEILDRRSQAKDDLFDLMGDEPGDVLKVEWHLVANAIYGHDV
jgi:hypothetical protein